MVAPTITTINPSSGRTLGETFVIIDGSDFNIASVGTVNVFFDGVLSPRFGVVDATRIVAITPRSTNDDPGPVDVRVENVTEPGPVIESDTVVDGFEYKRQSIATPRDLTECNEVLVVVRQLIRDFRAHVLANTHSDMHPDYADAVSALVPEEKQLEGPSIRLVGPSIEEDRFYSSNGDLNVQTMPSPGGTFDVHVNPVTVMLTYSYLAVARSKGEAHQLWKAITRYFNRTEFLEVPTDGVSKANGITNFEMSVLWDQRADFRARATRQGVYQFEGSFVVHGVHVAADKLFEGRDTDDVPTLTIEVKTS